MKIYNFLLFRQKLNNDKSDDGTMELKFVHFVTTTASMVNCGFDVKRVGDRLTLIVVDGTSQMAANAIIVLNEFKFP